MKPCYLFRLIIYSTFTLVFLCTICLPAFSQTSAEKVNISYYQSRMLLNKAMFSADSLSKLSQDTSFNKIREDLYDIEYGLSKIWRSGNYDNSNSNSDCKEKLIQDIDNYTALINNSLNIRNRDSLFLIFDFITQDIAIKTYNLTYYRAIGLVSVKVRVLDNSGKEIPGFRVFIKPALTLAKRYVEEFNPTTNAVKQIIPGVRLIWIEDNGIKVGERTEAIRWSSNTTVYDFIYKKQ